MPAKMGGSDILGGLIPEVQVLLNSCCVPNFRHTASDPPIKLPANKAQHEVESAI